MPTKKTIPAQQSDSLLKILKTRFDKNMDRHKTLDWEAVEAGLRAQPEKLISLQAMEDTGGEPDVVSLAEASGAIIFVDCAPESPKGRRSLCYDREGLDSRKEFKPENTAVDLANAMGIELLSESEYRSLQALGEFDLKTSSWLQTPASIRKLGGAIFGDRRYDTVFIYHNGAQSYYGGRGFRGSLRV